MKMVNARIIDCSKVRRIETETMSVGHPVARATAYLVSFYVVFPGHMPGGITSLYMGLTRFEIDGDQVSRKTFRSRWGDVLEGFIVEDLNLAQFNGEFPKITGLASKMKMMGTA